MTTLAFYDTAYGRFADELYASIRREAFGEDIGQNSWLTAGEQRTFCGWLGLDSSAGLLEVASGSGGSALFTAVLTGCRITGADIHQAGVQAATEAARGRGPLPFQDGSFDAIICVDSINHLYERAAVLRDWHRLVRSGRRILFTDAVTVTGLLRREEMIVRSGGMGEFVFTPAGLDETLIRETGFADVRVEDVSENPARVAAAWHAAGAPRGKARPDRGRRPERLHQRFRSTVAMLARERRLSRFAYMARRP